MTPSDRHALPGPAPLPPLLLTKAQVGEVLSLSPRSVDFLISRRELPFIRFGRSVRVHPDDLARLIESRRVKGAKS